MSHNEILAGELREPKQISGAGASIDQQTKTVSNH